MSRLLPEQRMLAEGHIRSVINSVIGVGPDVSVGTRESMLRTPERFVRALEEMTAGYDEDPAKILSASFQPEGYDEVVALSGIQFVSLCEHHLFPFSGTAGVAYLPASESCEFGARVVGISKLARVVDAFARRLQIQERMTREIADAVQETLKPRGVAVVVRGVHGCMAARGVRKPGAVMTTSVMLGVFREKPEARAEVMRMLEAR